MVGGGPPRGSVREKQSEDRRDYVCLADADWWWTCLLAAWNAINDFVDFPSPCETHVGID